MIEERAYWLAWSQIPGVGPILQKRLYEHFTSLAAAWSASPKALQEVEGFGKKNISAVVSGRSQLDPATFLQQHLVKNPHFWTPVDPDYPRLLLEIPSPPPVLYYQGQVDLSENQGITPMIGIVGTRHPTAYGKNWTHKISVALARHGFTIVSGMASGIDTQAHRGCLSAQKRTLAILGTGVDMVYPRSNLKLNQEIQEQGLILSEYPAGTPPEGKNFPARNRIIAGLCRAVLVMEAAERSGALITARYANDFCRDVYALPGSLDNPKSIGCLGLLNRGAHVILSEGHLLEMLGAIPQLDPVSSTSSSRENNQQLMPDLAPELVKILQIIDSEDMAIDLIVQKTGLETNYVVGKLLELELLGLVSQLPGMRYRKV